MPSEEEITGLTRALLAARLRSLTTSLWPLDDLVGAYLGVRVRALMGAGRDPAQALRQGALEVRAGGWVGIADWLSALAQARGLRPGERLLCQRAWRRPAAFEPTGPRALWGTLGRSRRGSR